MGNNIQTVDIINFSTGIAGAMLMFLGLLLSVSSEYMERWMRRYFVIFFLLMTVYVADQSGCVAFLEPGLDRRRERRLVSGIAGFFDAPAADHAFPAALCRRGLA